MIGRNKVKQPLSADLSIPVCTSVAFFSFAYVFYQYIDIKHIEGFFSMSTSLLECMPAVVFSSLHKTIVLVL